MNEHIHDLRSAIDLLQNVPGQMIETDMPVKCDAQIPGIYRYVGARGTVKRPTKIGPMMLFNNIEGFKDAKIAIGMLSSRERIGYLLNTAPDKLAEFYINSLNNPVKPIVITEENAPCHEEVFLASDPDFDLWKILPAPCITDNDIGHSITMGLCYAHDPETNEGNATIHRMCIQDKDILSIGFGGYRHIGVFRDKAFAKGESLPISVNIGLDPAVYLSSCFEPPTTPLGFDELTIAGAMRGKPVELTHCIAVNEYCIANAEIVIEGELLPGQKIMEDSTTHTGRAIPEFAGYTGEARFQQVMKVKAVTRRKNPIMQLCIGASEEHVNLAGIPTEAAILMFLERAMPGKVLNVFCPPSGGGKLNAIIQFKKTERADEGKQRQAALGALATYSELKNVFIVDDDVDIFDPYDVQWAMTTRFRPDKDIIVMPGVRGHLGDPMQRRSFDPQLPDDGIAYKAIYDFTAPFELKTELTRAEYREVDASAFI